MDQWLQLALSSFATLCASSGVWGYLQHKDRQKTAVAKLMMGMAYDRITTLGMAYIDRGWVTKDEYEELNKFFYAPYKALGGNGVAEHVMIQVGKLPFRHNSRYSEILNRDEGWVNNVRVVTREEQDTSVG